MAYYSRDSVEEFDDYDPTPYGGGYDQAVVYGKPRPPSEETCYPPARPSDHSLSDDFAYGSETSPYGEAQQQIDEDRPTYGSGSTHSYDGGSAQSYGVGSAYGRPKPQPAYGFQSDAPDPYAADQDSGSAYGRPKPQPAYGFQPDVPDPYADQGSGYSHSFGGGSAYGRPKPQPAYGFQPDAPDPYADQYGERPRPPQRFGGEEEYGRIPDVQEEPQQYHGGRWNKNEEYRSEGYGEQRADTWKPSYQKQEEEPSTFERPSYYRPEQEEGYQQPQYGYDYEGERRSQHHQQHHHHHHHKHYDDE